jgi:tRNA pseudouridine38-40 synthase
VPADFHARFLSSGKTYTYRILNSRHGSALKRNLCWHVPVPLARASMARALETLTGTHDFAAFQAAGGVAKTTVRNLQEAALAVDGPEFTLTVSGNAFLYNMVRIIAGTLVEIGLGRLEPDAFSRAFRSLDRLDLGMTAPPQGLELTEVRYPEEAFRNPAALRWHTEDGKESSC